LFFFAASATVDSVAAEIAERDRQDMNRSVAPLKQAEDAVFIDSSCMTAEEVLDAMVLCIRDGEKA
jgi:cytidylate kinase